MSQMAFIEAMKKIYFLYFYLFALLASGCGVKGQTDQSTTNDVLVKPMSYKDSIHWLFESHPEFLSDGFDFPVGKPNAKGYYNAQPFGKNNHLGDDWNGVGGGNSDLGDTIYAVSNGYITESFQFFGGWGKVVREVSGWKDDESKSFVESLYAHMTEVFVKKGQWVKKGQPIGTIGTAEGIYLAHLHHEIRKAPGLDLGGGYNADTTGFFDPTKFIKAHRK
jgi:murein DD-endopeptidase MepM/ murein hydrolase activator NlpD